MKLLETSFLVDYERGREPAKEWYHENADCSITASTVSMFEVAFGVIDSESEALEALRDSLHWVDFLPLSVPDAVEAARIDSELQDRGVRIPVGDTVVAGVARNRGASLVAADDHFERIDGLDVIKYRQ